MTVEELLRGIWNGEIVLPDFQRSFIWEPEDVRELLVSVLGNYFIGTMLILEHSKEESPFALRLFEGVEKVNSQAKIQSLVKIVLDGQQRATALFYALNEPDLPLKGRKSAYRFYLDVDKALEEEWNEAILAINLRDKRRLSEIQKRRNTIPFQLLKDFKAVAKEFRNHPNFERILEIRDNFMRYPVHAISLPKNTDEEKIVETFERINRTGEPLTVFELLTARLYKEGIKLREILEKTEAKYKISEFTTPESVLKVIALMRGQEPKRRSILRLAPQDFEKDWQIASESLKEAMERVTDLKQGYGVLQIKKWMPYSTMLVPLAALLQFLQKEKLDTPTNYEKIDCWYWTAVFSNRYDQAVDTIMVLDFNTVKNWILNKKETPEFIQKFDPDTIDLDVEKQTAAIYRGVINLVTLAGALDFKTGQPPQFDREKVQDDHIFPRLYQVDLVSNRTLITSNAAKGNKKPSDYFKERLQEHGEKKLKQILKTHLIPGDSLADLLNDNIKGFLEKRKRAIAEAIKEKVKLP